MSQRHPVIAVTGSSGAGTTTVHQALEHIFLVQGVNPLYVRGDAFRRYDRTEMKREQLLANDKNELLSHFGPQANLFERLENLFRDYGESGQGEVREYLDSAAEARPYGQDAGSFTPWRRSGAGSDLLLYEGLHGGVVIGGSSRRPRSPSHNPRIAALRQSDAPAAVDAARWVDLLIGVVPIINLEWIQKIHRYTGRNNSSAAEVTETILGRMGDYVRYILPQFTLTDINFQRVPLVDTSNPFMARDVPTLAESMVVVRFREPRRHDFPELLRRIDGAFMSRPNTLVLPGGSMTYAIHIICGPLIEQLMARRELAA